MKQLRLIFEIRNNGAHTLYDVVPTVIETTGNKHIFISPSVHVESIAPGHVIRYTAMVKADNRLKNGTACFCVSVIQGGKTIPKVNQFDIPTKSREDTGMIMKCVIVSYFRILLYIKR